MGTTFCTRCREEFPKGKDPRWHGRHVLFEYVLLHGINDQKEHAIELVELIEDVECKVNLIVFNPHEGTLYSASTSEAIHAFRCVVNVKGCHLRAKWLELSAL